MIKIKNCSIGKELNPNNGRCVNKCKKGKKRIIKTGKCDKIIKNLNSKPYLKNSSSIFIDNPIIKNNNILNNRINYYKKIKTELDKINSNDCLHNIKINNIKFMTLSNILFLDKRIGTKSVYASVYLTSIKDMPDVLLVSKVTNRIKNNLNEITIMNNLTNELLITCKTKHFPFIYNSFICNKKKETNKKSLISVNELCNGDLKMLLDDKHFYLINNNEKILSNIIFQIFISIATYQEYSKNIHNDCHYGNILYQYNNQNGYYKYLHNNKEFYLESCEYNMMLYDFGLSRKPIFFDYNAFYKDFYRIIHAFIPKSEGGWNIHIIKSNYTDKIIKIKNDIRYLLKHSNDYNFDTLINILEPIIKDVYKPILNKNDKLLNSEPFII